MGLAPSFKDKQKAVMINPLFMTAFFNVTFIDETLLPVALVVQALMCLLSASISLLHLKAFY